MSMRHIFVSGLTLSILIFHCWTADAQAPFFGTWKLNAEKSGNDPDPRYARVLSRIEPRADGLAVIYDMVGIRGGVTHIEWSGKFDGRDYAVQGLDYVMTHAYTLVDDRSYDIVVKVEGKPAATARVTVSPDGRTLTSVTTDNSAPGKASTTSVYDRQ